MRKGNRYGLLLAVLLSLVISLGATVVGMGRLMATLTGEIEEAMSDQIGKLQHMQQIRERNWAGFLDAQLWLLAGNKSMKTFCGDIVGIDVPMKTLEGLIGRHQVRESVLSGLEASKDPVAMQKLRDFSKRSDEIREMLNEALGVFDFRCITLVTSTGEIFMSTSEAPRKLTPELNATVVRFISDSTIGTLPAYRVGDRLYCDVVMPVRDPNAKPGEKSSIAALIVTMDLRNRMERTAAAINTPGGNTFLAEQQPDGSLVMLTYKGSNVSLPLHGWTIDGDNIPFGEQYVPDHKGSVYAIGKRLEETNLFCVSTLDYSEAEAALAGKVHFVSIMAMAVAAGIVLLLLFLLFAAFKSRERAIVRHTEAKIDLQQQRRQIVDAVDSEAGLAIACTSFDNTLLFASNTLGKLAGQKDVSVLFGKPLAALPQDVAANIAQHSAQLWDKGEAFATEDKIFADGNWHNFISHTCPYMDREGFMAGSLTVYQDVSELRECQLRGKKLVEQTVVSLHRLVAATDPYLGLQSTLISEVAQLLARLDGDESKETGRLLSMAGRLCKVGYVKTFQPGQGEPGPVDANRAVRTTGAVLGSVDFDGMYVTQTIVDMHERLDGTGIPRGIRGEQVGKPARYLAIADVFCQGLRPAGGAPAADASQVIRDKLQIKPGRFDDEVVKELLTFLKTEQGKKVVEKLLSV